jgi:hypothetical protein
MEAVKISIFLVLIIVTAFPLFAQSEGREAVQDPGDFTVTQNESGDVVITGYRGSAKDVAIPPSINGIPVTVIGRAAFRNMALSSVTIPESVTSIGDLAFADNELTELVLSEGLALIGISAFANNKLTNVVIPNSVTAVRYGAFNKNPVTAISISNRVAAVMPRVFSKNALSQITIGGKTEVYIENFEPAFVNYYISRERQAGTYVKTDGVWKLR